MRKSRTLELCFSVINIWLVAFFRSAAARKKANIENFHECHHDSIELINMKIKVNNFLLILLSALMIQSCTITKRYHSLGLNLELNASGNNGNDPSRKAKKGIASAVKNNNELLKDGPIESVAGESILRTIKNNSIGEWNAPFHNLSNIGVIHSMDPITGLTKVEKSTVVTQSDVSNLYRNKSFDNFQSNVITSEMSAPSPILPPDSLAIKKIANFKKTVKNTFFGGLSLVGTGILLIILDPMKMFFGGPMTVVGVFAILLGLILLTLVMWLAVFYLIKKHEYNRYHNPKI